jgi:hypothetical protein
MLIHPPGKKTEKRLAINQTDGNPNSYSWVLAIIVAIPFLLGSEWVSLVGANHQIDGFQQ